VEHAYQGYPPQQTDVAYGLTGERGVSPLVGASDELVYHDALAGHPEATWIDAAYDDSGWLQGSNGVGYSRGTLD